ncbi:MAG: glycosyltransferase [Acidobacteriaceae bacterium]|nr:glycosyltransferase [Acidobacteriaceae bacterium]
MARTTEKSYWAAMFFSIVIPTYNRAELLGQAIQSALAQTYSNLEILVVDDGSGDDTKRLIAKFQPSVSYVRQENQGKSAAVNLGIASARGDIILVLDDDDILPAHAIAKHAEALAGSPNANFSYGRFLRFKGPKLPMASDVLEEEFVPTRDPRRLVVKLMENCFLTNPTWAVRRAAQMKAGLYDRRLAYSQDYDMVLRYAKENEGIFVDAHVLYQRKHVSLRGPRSEQALVADTVEKWVKYDRLIFEEIDRGWDLAEFRPFDQNAPPDMADASPFLQKAVILFQRKVYGGAMRALRAYRSALETRPPARLDYPIAAGLLGCRYGIDDLIDDEEHGIGIAKELSEMRFPFWMRVALGSQIRWRIQTSLRAGDVSKARKLLHFSRNAFGHAAAMAVLGSSYLGGRGEWMRAA